MQIISALFWKIFTNIMEITIGQRFRKIRVEKNLTQEQFAEKLSCKRSDVTDIERDKKKPGIEILENLHIVFSINVNWLLFNLGNKNIETNKTTETTNDLFKEKYYQSLEKIEVLRERIEKYESQKDQSKQTNHAE